MLARPTILRPAVTGYPTLRIDRTGIWQLVAPKPSESAAARGALPGPEAADSVEPLEPSTDADPFQLPQQAWVSPREWIRNPSWINVFLSKEFLTNFERCTTLAPARAAYRVTPNGKRSSASKGAAGGAPGSWSGGTSHLQPTRCVPSPLLEPLREEHLNQLKGRSPRPSAQLRGFQAHSGKSAAKGKA